ncbi:hypothetical protein [Terriglobus roseus]|uniref:Uncharacterized protein n=1 Tax=Terriglobus roseus TaxID=392734 RepID=A0A1H4RD55_9BACT|nr:hypothetical protein [Terriglobus roseus]SEC29807.1 hypothetical protein SAMN05443244_3121 [Terriglobus roseus]
MTPQRAGVSTLLRVIVVNVFIVTGLVMVYRSGKLTGSMIAFYAFFFVAANALMYFSARARRRMLER